MTATWTRFQRYQRHQERRRLADDTADYTRHLAEKILARLPRDTPDVIAERRAELELAIGMSMRTNARWRRKKRQQTVAA